MNHVLALALTLAWCAANFYLWSFRHGPVVLFWESLAMAAFAYPLFGWYAMRTPR